MARRSPSISTIDPNQVLMLPCSECPSTSSISIPFAKAKWDNRGDMTAYEMFGHHVPSWVVRTLDSGLCPTHYQQFMSESETIKEQL